MSDTCDCDLCKGSNCLCEGYARFFGTLGNTNRMHIIKALRTGEKSVSDIIQLTNLEQTCVSHCLRQLEENGFVTSKRDGKFRIYSINKETIEPLMQLIDQHVHTHCIVECCAKH
ncbi:helix-turn-helix transcriptional regulator [Candidatus Woesearchaeota archaeon]|nr:helix-turn-helix transcriptional regulator [Candidatus Woesearchaeota archaeon]